MDYSNTVNALLLNESAKHQIYPTNRYNSQIGTTFVELMIVITIIVIVTGLSIPSFANLMARNKVTTQANTVFESLYLARSTAITQQKNVQICHMSKPNSLECNQQRDFNTVWSNGWLIFADVNGDNEYDEDDNLIKVVDASDHTNIVFNQQGRLRFFPDGSARSAGFYICDQQQIDYRHIYLLYSGRARISQSLTEKQRAICDAV